ncbi:MAG: hypothetical protein JSS82_19275 [Bacteroidetes bacterium]|nr:hypothetical protein [Bacteroidota bacterium]
MNTANENSKEEKEVPHGSDHGDQGKATFKPGSTTQGGSDFGQGSSNLGPESYEQGSEKNEGSNYNNERKPVPDNNNTQDIENGLSGDNTESGPNTADPNVSE